LDSPGSIVIHGGFTAAFYEFGLAMDDSTGGTGRLIISIACWLTRIEERLYLAKKTATPLVTTVPRLTENYSVSGVFSGWTPRPVVTRKRHSILVLDGSGSMSSAYAGLIVAANQYITIVVGNGGVISVVHFSSGASVIYERQTRMLGSQEGYDGGGTNFQAALRTTIPVVQRNPAGYECRILFFTDGRASIPSSELQQLRNMGTRMDVVGFGSVNQSILNQLVTCGGTVSIGRTMNDVQAVFASLASATG
jgi:hypothetical protein